jgi:hypothetical protein
VGPEEKEKEKEKKKANCVEIIVLDVSILSVRKFDIERVAPRHRLARSHVL